MYLMCPVCGTDCVTMPANAEGMWWDGNCGVCQCGANLCVYVDDGVGVGMASLCEVGDDEDEDGEDEE